MFSSLTKRLSFDHLYGVYSFNVSNNLVFLCQLLDTGSISFSGHYSKSYIK